MNSPKKLTQILLTFSTFMLMLLPTQAQLSEAQREQATEAYHQLIAALDNNQAAVSAAIDTISELPQSTYNVFLTEITNRLSPLETQYQQQIESFSIEPTDDEEDEIEQLREQLREIQSRYNPANKHALKDEMRDFNDSFRRLVQLSFPSLETLIEADPQLSALQDQLLLHYHADTRMRALGNQQLPSAEERIASLQANNSLGSNIARSDRQAMESIEAAREQLDIDEYNAMLQLNRWRIAMGLNALTLDMNLVLAARDHSNDMNEHNFFAHDSPVDGKTKFTDRASNFDTTANAENIARGQRNAQAVNWGWFNSPGHHMNLFRVGMNRIGVGLGKNRHWTQLFGG